MSQQLREAWLPRVLPARVKLLLYGNFAAVFGLVSLVAGTIFLILAYYLTDFASLMYFKDGDPTTTGVLLEKSQSGAKATGRKARGYYLYRYRYTYVVDEVSYHGLSYAKENNLESGAAVSVAYVPDKPALSRVAGMTSAPFIGAGIAVGIVAAAIAMLGMVSMCFGIHQARRCSRLVRNGRLATGIVTGKTAASTKTDGRQDYVIHVQFAHHDGRTHTASVTTNEIAMLGEGRDAKIVYEAPNPANALLVDSLPQKVRALVMD